MENNSICEIPSYADVRFFRNKLVRWFNRSQRNYPWRKTKSPFKVLIAEMMLRRTKADQVKSVYENLFAEYPNIDAVTKAKAKKLERILYPLGLNWRTPTFALVARAVKEKYNRRVPRTREELKSLPGVGDYVAGAVLSIAYNKKEWIVDRNIVRLFRRYFGIKTSKEGRRDKHVIEIARTYVSCKTARKANLGILDFTALICSPRNPKCESCPLRKRCTYKSQQSDFIKQEQGAQLF